VRSKSASACAPVECKNKSLRRGWGCGSMRIPTPPVRRDATRVRRWSSDRRNEMKLLFVAGHGRCDETVQKELPPRVSIKWYGQQGNPLTKGLTKQIMGGAVAPSATTPAL